MNKYADIYLGGTRSLTSTWRNDIIKILESKYPDITYYNPMTQIEDWTNEVEAKEEFYKEHSTVQLYCISPKMVGVYSIAELVDASNKRPNNTIGVFLEKDNDAVFSGELRSSIIRTFELSCYHNGAGYTDNLEDAANICAHIVRSNRDKIFLKF